MNTALHPTPPRFIHKNSSPAKYTNCVSVHVPTLFCNTNTHINISAITRCSLHTSFELLCSDIPIVFTSGADSSSKEHSIDLDLAGTVSPVEQMPAELAMSRTVPKTKLFLAESTRGRCRLVAEELTRVFQPACRNQMLRHPWSTLLQRFLSSIRDFLMNIPRIFDLAPAYKVMVKQALFHVLDPWSALFTCCTKNVLGTCSCGALALSRTCMNTDHMQSTCTLCVASYTPTQLIESWSLYMYWKYTVQNTYGKPHVFENQQKNLMQWVSI